MSNKNNAPKGAKFKVGDKVRYTEKARKMYVMIEACYSNTLTVIEVRVDSLLYSGIREEYSLGRIVNLEHVRIRNTKTARIINPNWTESEDGMYLLPPQE